MTTTQNDKVEKVEEHHDECGGRLEVGFGLAGGGYGAYLYCEKCGKIIHKTQVDV